MAKASDKVAMENVNTPGRVVRVEAAGGTSLIIIDPVVCATAADSHKNSETKRGLQPIVDMAAKLDAALLGITHFTKGSEGRSPIDRVTGSVAFGAIARVVMVAARQQDGDALAVGRGPPLRQKHAVVSRRQLTLQLDARLFCLVWRRLGEQGTCVLIEQEHPARAE